MEMEGKMVEYMIRKDRIGMKRIDEMRKIEKEEKKGIGIIKCEGDVKMRSKRGKKILDEVNELGLLNDGEM